MFHSKDMGEIWNIEILNEPTRGFPSKEHTNHIKYIKCTKILKFFNQIMKHRFFVNNWRSQCENFRKRSETGSIIYA